MVTLNQADFSIIQAQRLDVPISGSAPVLPSALAAIQATSTEVSPTKAQITAFVQNAPLFAHVRKKGEAISKLETVQQKVETQVKLQKIDQLFNTGPMTLHNPLFHDPDFEELVVLACISRRITTTQLGTAFYWKSALNHYQNQEIHEIPLFLHDGQINPDAWYSMK